MSIIWNIRRSRRGLKNICLPHENQIIQDYLMEFLFLFMYTLILYWDRLIMRGPQSGPSKLKKKKLLLYTIQILLFFFMFFSNGLFVWTHLTVRRFHTRLAIMYMPLYSLRFSYFDSFDLDIFVKTIIKVLIYLIVHN